MIPETTGDSGGDGFSVEELKEYLSFLHLHVKYAIDVSKCNEITIHYIINNIIYNCFVYHQLTDEDIYNKNTSCIIYNNPI